MKGHLLIAEDEPDLRDLLSEILRQDGHVVTAAPDGATALQALNDGDFDLVVSDIRMPGRDGLDFLRTAHELNPDLPVILVTGQPTLDGAIQALEHGALQYLLKPVSPVALRQAVQRGLGHNRMASLRREALEYLRRQEQSGSEVQDMGSLLDRALRGLWMAYQPIVRAHDASVYGYEALVRSAEPRLADPGALFDAAERTGRVWDVTRTVRSLVAASIPKGGATRFLNLHPKDLEDDRLYAPDEPLALKAGQVILEITERAALGPMADIRRNVSALRAMGYRIAVDDLGAGYSGLTSFAALEPDLVKLDMSLVRGIDIEPVKQKLVSSMTVLCRELGVLVVAEGVETPAERNVLVDLGCDLLQGFLFARPSLLPPDA